MSLEQEQKLLWSFTYFHLFPFLFFPVCPLIFIRSHHTQTHRHNTLYSPCHITVGNQQLLPSPCLRPYPRAAWMPCPAMPWSQPAKAKCSKQALVIASCRLATYLPSLVAYLPTCLHTDRSSTYIHKPCHTAGCKKLQMQSIPTFTNRSNRSSRSSRCCMGFIWGN